MNSEEMLEEPRPTEGRLEKDTIVICEVVKCLYVENILLYISTQERTRSTGK